LLPTLLAERRGSGTMKALTPAGLTRARQVSPLTPLCLPDIPTPTTRAARRSLCQSPQRHRLLPGFATNEQAPHPASRRRSYLQLRSPRLAPTRTSTMQTEGPHGAHSSPRTRGPRGKRLKSLGSRFRGSDEYQRARAKCGQLDYSLFRRYDGTFGRQNCSRSEGVSSECI